MKIDYKKMGFVLIKPPSKVVSYHLIKNASEHQKLTTRAVESGLCLYYAFITKTNGKYVAAQPWLLDESTIPTIIPNDDMVVQSKEEPITNGSGGLYCPFCEKPMSSTSGRTLHIKSQHPEKIQEYNTWLKSLGKKSSKKQQ